jgi:hypothetical protein
MSASEISSNEQPSPIFASMCGFGSFVLRFVILCPHCYGYDPNESDNQGRYGEFECGF